MAVTHETRGAHLVAQLEGSHEHFPAYHRLVMRLAGEARHDRAVARQLATVVGRYTSHLHVHHTAEEIELFPAITQARPDLTAAVDVLLGHHASLVEHLDAVNLAARLVQRAEDEERPAAVDHLVEQLDAMNDLVEHHLSVEEDTIVPVIATWSSWPF